MQEGSCVLLYGSLPKALEKGRCLQRVELLPMRPTIPGCRHHSRTMADSWSRSGKRDHPGPLADCSKTFGNKTVSEKKISLLIKTVVRQIQYTPCISLMPGAGSLCTNHTLSHPDRTQCSWMWDLRSKTQIQILAPLPSQSGTLFNLSEPQFLHLFFVFFLLNKFIYFNWRYIPKPISSSLI